MHWKNTWRGWDRFGAWTWRAVPLKSNIRGWNAGSKTPWSPGQREGRVALHLSFKGQLSKLPNWLMPSGSGLLICEVALETIILEQRHIFKYKSPSSHIGCACSWLILQFNTDAGLFQSSRAQEMCPGRELERQRRVLPAESLRDQSPASSEWRTQAMGQTSPSLLCFIRILLFCKGTPQNLQTNGLLNHKCSPAY